MFLKVLILIDSVPRHFLWWHFLSLVYKIRERNIR